MFVEAIKSADDSWWVVKNSSLENPWSISGVQQPATDSNGYPIGLGKLPSQGYALSTAPFLHNGKNFPAGAYTLIFDGDGTVVVHQGENPVSTVDQTGGIGRSHTVNVVQSDLGIIVRSNPNDYVRNIRLVMPGFQDTYQSQPHPADPGVKSHPLVDDRRANLRPGRLRSSDGEQSASPRFPPVDKPLDHAP